MGDLDDRLRRRLAGASRPVGTDGLIDRLAKRRRGREIRTKVGVSFLSLALAGSVLTGLYWSRELQGAGGEIGGGGVIVFTRTLRECSPGVVPTKPPQLFAVTPDGSTEWNLSRQVLTSSGYAVPGGLGSVSTSPDGARMAWPWGRGLAVLDLANGSVNVIELGKLTGLTNIAFSPDGRTIAFQALRPDEFGFMITELNQSLWSVPADGAGDPTRLTTIDGLPLPVTHDGPFAWSPDGQTIAFIRTRNEDFEDMLRVRQTLMFVDADGSNLREIERQPEEAEFTIVSADWAPDGTRFVAEAQFGENADLFIANIDGRTGYRLTEHPEPDRSGTWSPDGTLIAFQTGRWGRGQGHSEIAITDPSGEEIRRVTDNCWDDQSPAWVSDASYIRSLPPWRSDSSDTDEPPLEETPEAEGRDVGLEFNLCDVASIGGLEFGAEAPGRAWTGVSVTENGTCHEDPAAGVILAIDQDGDTLADSWWGPLDACYPCRPLGGVDLDVDGVDEVVVQSGFSVAGHWFFRLVRDDGVAPQVEPILVASPGHKPAGIQGDEPLVLGVGGDEGFSGYLRCETYPESPILVYTTVFAEVDAETDQEVHETRLNLGSDGRFHVVDTNDLTVPRDEPIPLELSTAPACGLDFHPGA